MGVRLEATIWCDYTTRHGKRECFETIQVELEPEDMYIPLPEGWTKVEDEHRCPKHMEG